VDSRVVSRVTRYSGIPYGDFCFRLRASHPLWSRFPSASPNFHQSHIGLLQPRRQCLRFGLFRVRSPLLAESIVFFIFLRLLRCFTSPGIAFLSLCIQERTAPYYCGQVTPFGNLRINAYLPLPEAYRSLSRPSSPSSTKAFTVCPL